MRASSKANTVNAPVYLAKENPGHLCGNLSLSDQAVLGQCGLRFTAPLHVKHSFNLLPCTSPQNQPPHTFVRHGASYPRYTTAAHPTGPPWGLPLQLHTGVC